MNWSSKILLALGSLLLLAFPERLLCQQVSPAEPELWVLHKVVRKAIARVAPSVVTVETFGGFRKVLKGAMRAKPKLPGSRPKKKKGKKKGLGPIRMPGFIQAQGASTGLVLAADGWILTSSFALNWDPSTILVTLNDGRRFTAKVAGRDETRGLALLKVEAEDLPVPRFAPLAAATAQAADRVEVGQWAFAVARSLAGRQPTVHVGTVSALGRISGKAIQCDANTSPANYGGPLVDIAGRVLGLIVPLSPQGEAAGLNWYDSGIGFAATLQNIPEILEGMKAGKVYRKGLLGVRMDPGKLGPGATVAMVLKDSAAQQAGLRKKDKILSVDGVLIRNSSHLQDRLGYSLAGSWVRLRYLRTRDKSEVEVLVQLDG